MSDKAIKPNEKNKKTFIGKWLGILFVVLCLMAIAVLSSVMFFKYQNIGDTTKLNSYEQQLSSLGATINNFNKQLEEIKSQLEHHDSAYQGFESLSSDFYQLKEEVGNNKLDIIQQQLSAVKKQAELASQLQSNESIALAVTLIIKENMLYHQPFIAEADILKKLVTTENLIPDIDIIEQYKDKEIVNNIDLAREYNNFSQDFVFKKSKIDKRNQQGALNKGKKFLHSLVSGIRFDKIITLKKEKKTDAQKKLLSKLEDLVNAYNFTDALNYIEENPELKNLDDVRFINWQQNVKIKLALDKAVANIINSQLKAIRKDVLKKANSDLTESFDKTNVDNKEMESNELSSSSEEVAND